MYEFICEFAALEPPPPELQQLFSDGSRQPGGHGWIWRIPQRFLPLQPKRYTVLLLLLRVSSRSTSEAVLN